MTSERQIERLLSQQEKFAIAYQSNFTCGFCRAQVAHDNIQIDHLVPISKGGSDHRENLIAACKKCNQTKADQIAFPLERCEGKDAIDPDWLVLRSYGNWQIKFHLNYGVVLEHNPQRYCIHVDLAHDPLVADHVLRKAWMDGSEIENFCDALAHFQRLTCLRRFKRRKAHDQ